MPGFEKACRLFQNEKFSSVKDKIQKRLDVPEKEFEKVCLFF